MAPFCFQLSLRAPIPSAQHDEAILQTFSDQNQTRGFAGDGPPEVAAARQVVDAGDEIVDPAANYARAGGNCNTVPTPSLGNFVMLPGPSGCGKITLLRAIAGLEFPDNNAGRALFVRQDEDEACKLSGRFIILSEDRI